LRVGGDGAYRFEGLTPGSWRVDKRDEDLLYGYTRRSPARRPFPEAVKWNCEVKAGKTTWFDLHLEGADAYRLEGVLLVDGGRYKEWKAWLCPLDAKDYYDNLAGRPTVTLDPKGRFSLGASAAGEYRLVIKGQSRPFRESVFLDSVRLRGAITSWKLEVATGVLAVEGLGRNVTPGSKLPSLMYMWEGAGGALFGGMLIPDQNGACRLDAVPVGKGMLVRPSLDTILNPRRWEAARHLRIEKGRETHITVQ
jgi:hypothetical protein